MFKQLKRFPQFPRTIDSHLKLKLSILMVMAISLKRVPHLIFTKLQVKKYHASNLLRATAHGYDNLSPPNQTEEFLKWHNGGGTFHNSARIDQTAIIEIGAIVHSKAALGADVHVGSGAVIGPAVSIGHSSKIGYNAALNNCCVGDSCVIHHGVCIGQDGFGFFVDGDGYMVKKPQLLNARVGNHVEIGANSCIDRGSWRDTVIGDHSKIDNLVQIGHNVVIGKSCMLCGQVGIAGSVTIGDYVTMGGRVAVRDHVSIASKVRLAANSCVTKDIRDPGDYGGFPAVPIHEWRRLVAHNCRMSKKDIPIAKVLGD